MDGKQAFCCLNCTASPNCCGTCGECPVCCDECGDTSICQPLVYIDQNNDFYKGYIATQKFYYEEGKPVMPFSYQEYYKNFINATYNSIENKTTFYGGAIWQESNYSSVCDDPEQDGDYWFIQTSSSFFDEKEAKDQYCITSTDGACSAWKGCGDGNTYPSGPYSFTPKMPDCPQPNNYSSDIRKVTWINPLRLFNNVGVLVAHPWSILNQPSPFDPCNPIRIVAAPACHYFA